ncbi:MAG TPA: URC4/urg3 family protein [Kofleriaceae bacterium]|nr:URC4/urg3 family protein [Kofleriaceae bacterium]
MPELAAAIAYLRSPLAIRARCEAVFDAALAGSLDHFTVDPGALPAVADRVVAVTRAAYPSGKIPVHGRTNHFRAGGVDRVAALDARLAGLPPDERARAWVDLIVVSVLLDAGAGDAWRYREPGTDVTLARSEGLAVASLHAFEAGAFSSDPARPLAADAAGLRALDPDRLARAFQVAADNPIAGFDGRVGLVRALGDAVAAAPRWFPGERPGGLVDSLGAAPGMRSGGSTDSGGAADKLAAAPDHTSPFSLASSPGDIERSTAGTIDAAAILAALLDGLAPIWPGRIELGGVNLGDVWRHPAAGGSGPSAGLVPFHKLSQWLAYSLFEPLERTGKTIVRPGALTGLSEYRNGGLFVDLGVIVPRRPDIRTTVHSPGDEVIVEWRVLTVALLDRIAEAVRERLGKSPAELPLACVLEGGTWAAGRAVAAELRPGGGPPIQIRSDGTVF